MDKSRENIRKDRLTMTEIPWAKIGKPLEDLLRYERQLGHYEHAGYDLISTLVHSPIPDRSNRGSIGNWRSFILGDDHFETVVSQVIAISIKDSITPKTALDTIRTIAEAAYANFPQQAPLFLEAYLKQRPYFPGSVRDQLDQLAAAGTTSIPLCAAALAVEIQRAKPVETQDEAEKEVFDHWYGRIVREEISEHQAKTIPAQILEAEARLLEHLQEMEENVQADKATLYKSYSCILKSNNIPTLTDLVTAASKSGLGISVEQVENFLENLSRDEALHRFEQLGAWIARINNQNHDGVTLTPVLTDYLAQPSDFESLIGELDRLRAETRAGHFRMNNELQKELEYMRFTTEYNWQFDEPLDTSEHYAMFEQLQKLPPPCEEEFELDGQHLVEVRRVAYEAVGFLRFLREFRARTSRRIAVIGNDRYGRQWVVEPQEDYLHDGFTLHYFRNPSHMSMRLKVRHELFYNIRMGFTRDFVKDLNQHMPHVVIADSCSPRGGDQIMQLSRGCRDYVNWFMVFNDIRAQSDGSRYEAHSSLPPEHLPELKKWHEFTRVRRQLQDWVDPGPTYKIAHWAPVQKETVLLGDFTVPRKDPDLDDDSPQVIIANPVVYPDDNNEIPEPLRGTSPYYFDDPERYEKEEVLFGFGDHGFETRLKGVTTDTFVAAIQHYMKTEIDRLLRETGD